MTDHYTILDLPFTESPIPKQQLKLAYHRALLRHHPDKAPSTQHQSTTTTTTTTTTPTETKDIGNYTIDSITTAYKTLSTPSLRTEYNRALRLDRLKTPTQSKTGPDEIFHTGLEVVDLEDLTEETSTNDEDEMSWSRACRCGDERGFLVTEGDLDREMDRGEVVVGCRGCSLYMKVLFAVES